MGDAVKSSIYCCGSCCTLFFGVIFIVVADSSIRYWDLQDSQEPYIMMFIGICMISLIIVLAILWLIINLKKRNNIHKEPISLSDDKVFDDLDDSIELGD